MPQSNLQLLRKTGKGAVTTTEAASTNTCTLPPGEYDIQVIVTGATTGAPTSVNVEIMDSADGSSFASLADQRQRNIDLTKAAQFFLRGVRIVRWAAGSANVGAAITVTGGSSPSTPAINICAYVPGSSQSYNGQP